MIPVIGIVGRQSNVGKTEVVTRLISEIKSQGYKVATIKHDVHGFDIDHPGKDTYRHYASGADQVIISSRNKMAKIERVEEEYTLSELISTINNVDFIIVEGYKNSNIPKIEVLRRGYNEVLYTSKDQLLACVCDFDMEEDIPVFHIDQIKLLFQFIKNNL